MIRAALALGAAAALFGCKVAEEPATEMQEKQAVLAMLAESAAGWNSGDIDRFMSSYADEPTTSIVTEDGLVRGKAAVRQHYLNQFDFADAAKRGALSLETLDFRPLDTVHALYVGRYTLVYADGTRASGYSSLVLEKEEDRGWRIVADHST